MDRPADYVAALDPDSLRGARVGVWHVPAEPSGIMESAVDALRAAGATVVEVTLPHFEDVGEHELPAMWAEFRHDLEAYLATRDGAPATFAELIEFNKADPVELSKFPQDHFERAAEAPPLTDSSYRSHRAQATEMARRSVDATLASHELDAIVAVTNGPAWRIGYHPSGDHDVIGSSSAAAVAGYPSVTVPAGFVGALPVGVSFFAGRFEDAKVLSLAAAFEAATKARRAPRFLPTVD